MHNPNINKLFRFIIFPPLFLNTNKKTVYIHYRSNEPPRLPLFFSGATSFRFSSLALLFLRLPDYLERIGFYRGGNADLLPAFLDPDDLSYALQAYGTIRIDVFQHDGELYGLAGSNGFIRLEEYPRVAEVAGDAFAFFKFYGQGAFVTGRPAFFRFIHYHSSRVWQ